MALPEHEEVDDGFTRESFERLEEDTGDEMTLMDVLAESARNMQMYGGGFAKAIGLAYQRADSFNSERLVNAFPELFEKYHPKNWA